MSTMSDAVISTAMSWLSNYGAMRAQEIIARSRKAPHKNGIHTNSFSPSSIRHQAMIKVMNTTTKNYSRYGKHVDYSYWYTKGE